MVVRDRPMIDWRLVTAVPPWPRVLATARALVPFSVARGRSVEANDQLGLPYACGVPGATAFCCRRYVAGGAP